MKPRIKIVPIKEASVVSDQEIQDLMNFDGLVQSAGQLTLWAKVMGTLNAKLITGSLAVVSVSSVLVWVNQDNAIVPPENQPVAEQTIAPPEDVVPAAADSAAPIKEVAVHRLPPVREVPKEPIAEARQEEAEPGTPVSTSPVAYQEAEPVLGFAHLYEYFAKELKYPEEALQDSIQGVATVAFVIDRKGNLGKVTIVNSLGPAFDAEAIRLVKGMPAWKPATINGQPVLTRFSIPLNFKIEKVKK